jgi:hypothetical protein
LNKVLKKLKKSRNNRNLIRKLLKIKSKLMIKSRIDKIDFLINWLK